jgi:hypothetical protein
LTPLPEPRAQFGATRHLSLGGECELIIRTYVVSRLINEANRGPRLATRPENRPRRNLIAPVCFLLSDCSRQVFPHTARARNPPSRALRPYAGRDVRSRGSSRSCQERVSEYKTRPWPRSASARLGRSVAFVAELRARPRTTHRACLARPEPIPVEMGDRGGQAVDASGRRVAKAHW